MRIIANKIVTHHERSSIYLDEIMIERMINMDLANSIAKELINIPSLVSVDDNEMGKEYRMEIIVLNKETFNNIMLTLQENDIKKSVREKIRTILMNQI